MRSGPVSVLLVGSCFVLACQPQFTVPDSVIITCSTGDKCPTGLTCSEALGRCIRPGDDGLPLTVAGNPAWNTTKGAAGTVFQVSFSTSKPLGTDPLVQVQIPKDQSFRPLAQVSASDLTYTYAYRVAGDEGDGVGAVTVRLVDTFGKVADAQALGTVTFAFTAAGIAADSVKIVPPYAQEGTIVFIRFKPTVEGTTIKRVRVGATSATATDPQPTDGTVEYQFGVQGGAEGARAITADLVGPGGTESPATPVGTLIADFTAPTVTHTDIEKDKTHPGDSESVTVTLSEAVATTPRLELRRGAANPTRFTTTQLSATQFRFDGVIRPADVGTPAFTLSLAQDFAGNSAIPREIGTVSVSTSKPALASALTQLDPKAWLTTGDVVKVSFVTAGPVEAPDVRVASVSGQSVAMTQVSSEPAGSTGGSTFVYSHTVAAADPQGGAHIDVRIKDLFGNSAGPFSTGQFIVDTAAPTAAAGLSVSPASPLGLGDLLVVTVNANKVLNQATLVATPPLEFTETLISGTAAIWTHTVTASDASAAYSLVATVVDRAGNSTTVTPSTVTLDTVLPGATTASAGPSFATIGTVVRAIFDVTEQVPSDPVVTLGDVLLTKDTTTSSGTHYVYTHVVGATEVQHALPVAVALTDLAGNTNSVLLGQVELDFSLITPADITVTPANAAPGDTITIIAQAHNPLGMTANVLVRSSVGLDFGTATISGSTATWTHIVTAADATGPLDLTVSVSNEAEHSFPIQLDAVATIGSGT